MELDFKFTADDLIPAIVQQAPDAGTPGGRVLMFAWMNREALQKTLETGLMHYGSRQTGGACHTGYGSCFFQELDREARPLPVTESKTFDDKTVYQ